MSRMPLSAPFLARGAGMVQDDSTKTLWIFGAGASAHLEFPVSGGFLKATISLVTGSFKEVEDLRLDFGRWYKPESFLKPDSTPITNDDVRAFKTDPVLAFDCMQLWAYGDLEWGDQVRLQHLLRELGKLKKVLSNVGIEPATSELLDIAPENLIRQLRELDPDEVQRSIGRGRDIEEVQLDIQRAQECIQLIYFYALSEFNERARGIVLADPDNSCYEQLVRAFQFEKNSRVLSFNYDTVLDEVLFRRFTKTWAYERIHLAGINGYPVSAGAEADLLFIKPHGSLNMLVCPNCQRTHIQWFARFIPRGGGQAASDNRRCAHCKDVMPGRSELLRDLTVPPLYDKEVIEGSKGAIRRAFAWANNIISIGYSYPDQDTYLYECMADGLSANHHEQVNISLVLRGRAGTDDLKARLLGKPNLSFLSEPRFTINAMDLAGFEAI